MSLINEALIKAERERAEEAAARASGLPVEHPKYRAEKRRHSRQLQSVPLALVNAAVLLACFAAIILIVVRNRPVDNAPSIASSGGDTSTPSALASTPAPRSTFAPSETSQASPPEPPSDSPFISAPALPPEPAASAEFELVGMSALGNNTLLGITRRSDQRSVWVPVGKSVGGITAVSYDPDSDRAIIRVNGREHALGLRTGGSIAAE